ncbi:MAG: FtsQ-type POTRA domain-containing protein [Bryobacterales bacterium]|nr:FtsQ-type POTRA domain-containing protein [Bryobacterales bacterium]
MAKSRTTLEREEAPGEGLVAFDDGSQVEPGAGAAKRNRRGARTLATPSRRRTLLIGLIVSFFLVVFVAAVALAYQVDTFLATDGRFTLAAVQRDGEVEANSPLEIVGLEFTLRDDVLRVFEKDIGRSLYLLPLEQRRRELLAIDWVENATVSRVWPNRLRVSIHERTPIAVAAIAGRRGDALVTKLVDGHGQLMSRPARASFNLPVVFGLHQDQPIAYRKARIDLLEKLQAEVEPLNARFSELHMNDPRNLRATLVKDGRNLTLLLGNEKYLTRVQNFLNNYEAVMKEDPRANLFDMRLEDRIVATREGLSGA